MTPISILHIVEDMKIGGLENVLASIVLGLDRRKYRSEVWCLSEGREIADELMQKGIKIQILNLRTYHNPFNLIRLAGLMRKEQFNILHAHGYYASTFGRISAMLAGIPVILTHVHSTYFNYSKRNLWVEKMLSHVTDKVICVSKAVQSFVIEYEKIRQEKTCVIYNGLDIPTLEVTDENIIQTRSSLEIGDSDIVLIVVASLNPHKGHSFLFHALQKVSEDVSSFKVLVVGDGPQRKELEMLAKHLGIASRVIFTGTRSDVPYLLRISDIFVLPSTEREGLGMAVIEAMASRLPVISTLLGGIPEVVKNGTNGFLVNPGDQQALAEVLIKLIKDGEMRNKMGEAGREIYIRNFTLSKMLQDIEKLYDHLLKREY